MVEQNRLKNSRPFERITYEDLNDALCRAIFTPDMSNRPVYLELTAEVVDQVSNELGIDPNSLEDLIFESVNSKLLHSNEPALFDSMKQELALWFRDCKLAVEAGKEIPNYPHLPLLISFTISAADMGTEGGFSTNAYYPRLRGNLGLDESDQLDESYRKIAFVFWNGLNYWLDKFLNGTRGVGTAYSISAHKYVGLALSQALLRSVDRKKLPRVFHENNLAPFTSLVERDMEGILDSWIKREETHFRSYRNPSAPLKKLWEKEDARLRISSIACRELELWDGSIQLKNGNDEELSKQDFRVRLSIFESSFPALKMNFSFSFNAPNFLMSNSEVKIVGNDDVEIKKIPVSQDQTGWWQPNTNYSPIDARNLLEGILKLDIGLDFNIERFPRQLVVLRHDELSRIYYEVERIEIGIRTIFAMQNNPEFVTKVKAVLEACARPGWQIISPSASNGIPDGWLIAKDVEFLTPPSDALLPANGALEALKPIFAGSLNFSNGLQLPGRPPRWHSDVDFEIRGMVLGAETLEIKILQVSEEKDSDLEEVIDSKIFNGSLGIWKIESQNILDGDYRVQMLADSNPKPVTEKTLRLRSSNSIDEASWKSSERLIHDLTNSGIGAIQTRPLSPESKTYVDGSVAISTSESHIYDQEAQTQVSVWWLESKDLTKGSKEFTKISLPSAMSATCFGTSQHNFVIPPTIPSKSRQGFQKSESGNILGTCKYCGLNKKFAANRWVAEKRKINRENKLKKDNLVANKVEKKEVKVAVDSITPIQNQKIKYRNLLDAVMHVGGGSGAQLDSLSASMDSGALFRYQLIQDLIQLSVIDCRIDEYFQIVSWEVAPTAIVSCGDGGKDKLITGFFSKALLNSIQTLLSSGEVVESEDAEILSLPRIIGASEPEIMKISSQLGIPYSETSTLNMLTLLPAITEVAGVLPKKAVPGYEYAAEFETITNSWQNKSNIEKVGAYRVSGDYRNRYIVRLGDDLMDNSARFVSSEFAKHFQAAASGTPLMAYDSESNHLIVPLGAPLPGLYGRACVLASGRLPIRDRSGRNLIYTNIEMKVARLIFAKFGGAMDE